MTAQSQQKSASDQTSDSHGTAVQRREQHGSGGLQTDHGSTTIADAVVTKVAGIAAREVDGVYQLGAGAARAVGALTQRVGIGDPRTQGVSVEVGEKEAAVDLTVLIEYGESIPEVTQRIRDNVTRRIEGICGLHVTEVNISVTDLHFAGDDDQDDQSDQSR